MSTYAASALSRTAGASSVASCVMREVMAAGTDELCTGGAGSPATAARTNSPSRPPSLSNIALVAVPAYLGLLGLYLYFWPPRVASYIKPPLATVNTAMPFWYPLLALAFSLLELALVPEPAVEVDAEAAAVIATAVACAPNSKLPLVNLSKDSLFSKKIICR